MRSKEMLEVGPKCDGSINRLVDCVERPIHGTLGTAPNL